MTLVSVADGWVVVAVVHGGPASVAVCKLWVGARGSSCNNMVQILLLHPRLYYRKYSTQGIPEKLILVMHMHE